MQEEWHLEYLNRVMSELGITASALAERAGVSNTTLTRPLNNPAHKFRLSNTTLEKIRAATGIPFFSSENQEHTRKHTDQELVLVYDVAASAGFGSVVEGEEPVCNMAFEKDFLRQMTSAKPRELAIIRVKGHSMEPTLLDDDHVLVDMTKTNLAFDGLFVIRFDDVLHVKRVGRSATQGQVLVISDHPAYRDLDMPKENLDVIGRVLWVGRKV